MQLCEDVTLGAVASTMWTGDGTTKNAEDGRTERQDEPVFNDITE